MDIEQIKAKAKKQIDDLEEDDLVSSYRELLELKKSTEKQLKKVNESIKKFEADPEAFVEENEDLW